MSIIKSIQANKILDSRGDFTLEVKVVLEDGAGGKAAVPAGASVGQFEAKMVPVEEAIANVNETISSGVLGLNAENQKEVDDKLIKLDGTEDKSKLGANAILPVSLATACAAANSKKIPLYEYLHALLKVNEPPRVPTPILNFMNGGKHASNDLDIQEFLVAPATHLPYEKALEMGVTAYHKLERMLEVKGLSTEVGDEGGFGPKGLNTAGAIENIYKSLQEAGLRPGSDVFLGLDVAADSLLIGNSYSFKGEGQIRRPKEMIRFYEELASSYPLIYLEDPVSDEDWEAWKDLTRIFKGRVDIVGDDLTVTNSSRIKKAIDEGAITAVIIKPNQVGTLTETLDAIRLTKEHQLGVIVSHRSGETVEDTFISDLAVAAAARYLKAGAPARGERVVKYNRLLEISRELGRNG